MSEKDGKPIPLRPNQDILLRLRGLPARPVSENEPGTVDPRDAEIAALKQQLAEAREEVVFQEMARENDDAQRGDEIDVFRARIETLETRLRRAVACMDGLIHALPKNCRPSLLHNSTEALAEARAALGGKE